MQLGRRKRQLEESAKERQGLWSEIEKSSQMLVTGIEKISGKVNDFGGSGSTFA